MIFGISFGVPMEMQPLDMDGCCDGLFLCYSFVFIRPRHYVHWLRLWAIWLVSSGPDDDSQSVSNEKKKKCA
jgi:hypothetical protein